MAATAYPHIELNTNGVPCVDGTRLRVQDVAAEHIYWGRDAHEIQRAHPPHTLGQIYSALAYYYDHKDEIDGALAHADQHAEISRPHVEDPELARRLKDLKRAARRPA